MHLLHPIFLIIFLAMILLFFTEEKLSDSAQKYSMIFIGILLVIGAGGRDWVGADFPVYYRMYFDGFPNFTTYADVWHKATFQPNSMEIEWLYVLLNKIFYDLRMPFFMITMVMIIGSVWLQFSTFRKYSAAPMLSLLFYFMPLYFFADCGQMRQGMGTAICIFAVRYIIKKDLKTFLIVMFFALGMHKSTIVFLPAYWIAKLPLNRNMWIPILIGSVLLAPFEIYNYFGSFFSALAPQDVSNAFEGYSNDSYYGQEMKSGLGDVINVFWIIFILVFDKKAQEKMPYYEYYRNLALFGYCLYYIMRGNMIFATRLPGVYLAYSGYLAIPAILMSMKNEMKTAMRLGFVTYFLLFCFAFSKVNAEKGRFTSNTYHNIFW